jgi:hypothetical protein
MHYIFTRVIVDETQIYVFHPNDPQELVELRHELEAAQQALGLFLAVEIPPEIVGAKSGKSPFFYGRYSMIPRLGGIFICNYPKISLFQVSEF